MIIECICGEKKFEVNSDLIPSTGRNIQCGSCDKIWFFNPNIENLQIKKEKKTPVSKPTINKYTIEENKPFKKKKHHSKRKSSNKI